MTIPEQPIWVTGAGGLVGSELVRSSPQWVPDWPVRPLTRSDLDLCNPAAVREMFARERPAMIIHCAALSKSPLCDADPQLASRTNVDATRYLCETGANIPFIFFSTDLIFDGAKGSYSETDPPNPLLFYGETKVRAENIVREHPQHTIIRLSLTGGRSPTGDRGFNEEMIRAWRAGKCLNLFTDEYRSPTFAEVVARAVWELAASDARGIFHLCGAEKLSRYQIGLLLAEKHPEVKPQIQAGSRQDYKGPARPPDTTLSIAKVQQRLSFWIPGFSESLRNRVD